MATIPFEKFEIDEEARGITFSVASDQPYERYDCEKGYPYEEVLVVSEEAVDLHRLNGGAAVLWGHDTDDLLGIVERAWVDGDRVYVRCRFSRHDPHADRVWADILDGTIRNVSIGYAVNHYTEKREGNTIRRYVDAWMPYECSIVSVPADETVGIRSMKKSRKEEELQKPQAAPAEAPETPADAKVVPDAAEMPKEPEDAQEAPATAQEAPEAEGGAEKPDDATARIAELEAEIALLKGRMEDLEKPVEEPAPAPVDAPANNEDAEEIKACGDALGVPKEEQEKAIGSGMTARDFKAKFRNFEIISTEKKEHKMTKFQEYLRAGDFSSKFTFNRDAPYGGFGGQSGEGGASLIGTETKPLVAALEKVIGVKGFRTMAGLTSNISIPVQTSRNVIYKTDHLRDAGTASNPAMTPVAMSPVKLTGNTRIGKELLVQANDDIEAFVIDSLTKEIGYKVEDYLLGKVATGAGGSVTYSALSAIDWDDILAFEAAIGGYALTEPAYVMSPTARAALKGIAKVANYPAFLCENNEINGYKVNVSGCVANNDIYFGDWSKLLLGIWGEGLEIMVNPYTYAKEGDVEIVASMCVDAAVLQADAFVVGSVEASSSSSN